MDAPLLAHAPDALASLRRPTADDPLRVLISGCLAGRPCGVDATDYGMGHALGDLVALPTVRVVSFCPEDHGMGTPRTMPDLHGGDGHAVLSGHARVLDEHGTDLTDAMLAGATAMVDLARAHRIELCILTDMSAACGSQVISDGCRLVIERRFQRGVGVAAAMLLRAGFPVVSQRDFRTLGHLRTLLDPSFSPDPGAHDHHETDWFTTYFSRR